VEGERSVRIFFGVSAFVLAVVISRACVVPFHKEEGRGSIVRAIAIVLSFCLWLLQGRPNTSRRALQIHASAILFSRTPSCPHLSLQNPPIDLKLVSAAAAAARRT
jgi:uncharacterized membrane protein YoaK (UPF0700 family)